MSDSKAIRFLYDTAIGRLLLKGMVSPGISKIAAKYLSSGASVWLIDRFVKNNGIDLSRYKIPENGYSSFNEFFMREIKDEFVSINSDRLICPCDGLLTVSDISADSVFNIKQTFYSVKELLKDADRADEYNGGSAFIFRLTPSHYHRYMFCASGKVNTYKRIDGVLHSVQPICHEKTDVFIQNSREYIAIDNQEFGEVVQMEVGAMLVGKITNYELSDRGAVIGEYKGNFEYGGSSIVVLTRKKVELSSEIAGREKIDGEIPVHIGESLIK